jgi:hypothetical protein
MILKTLVEYDNTVKLKFDQRGSIYQNEQV